jgi:hypothetical protein
MSRFYSTNNVFAMNLFNRKMTFNVIHILLKSQMRLIVQKLVQSIKYNSSLTLKFTSE